MTPPSRLLRQLAPAARISPNRQQADLRIAKPAVSRLNAHRHPLTTQFQLLPDAEPAEFAAFIAPIVDALAPVGPLEAELARHIAIAHWRLSRIQAMEARLFAGRVSLPAECEIATVFAHLSRYERSIRRSLKIDLKLLQRSGQHRTKAALEVEARAESGLQIYPLGE